MRIYKRKNAYRHAGGRKLKQKIRNYIDKHQDELFQTIQELVQIETVVGNEFEGQQYIKQKYKEIGLDVHEFEPCKEELMRHEAFVDSGISFTNRKIGRASCREGV